MPAIQVARTDTFEQQRVKINQIGDQIFNISAGGSDLATGNLKLGDGTKSLPSLGFTNQESLGFYRPASGEIGYVFNNKDIFNISLDGIKSFRDINIVKRVLSTPFLTITEAGQYYDPGSYTDIAFTGGSGQYGTGDFTVSGVEGTIVSGGSGYEPGSYVDIPLTGGSGTGITAQIEVDDLEIEIVTRGSNYEDGFYSNIPLTGGSGSGAEIGFAVTDGEISGNVNLTLTGSGYSNGDILSVNPNFDGVGAGSGFTLIVSSSPGSISTCQIFSNGSGYIIGDTLGINSNFDSVGSGSGFSFEITNIGSIVSVVVNNPGLGYSAGDTLSVSPTNLTQKIGITNYVLSVNVITFSSTISAGTFSTSDRIAVAAGGVDALTITASSSILGEANNTYTGVSATGGTGSGATFNVARGFDGSVNSVSINNPGTFYTQNDTLTIAGNLVGGSTPADNIVFTLDSVTGSAQDYGVLFVKESGGNTSYIITEGFLGADGDSIVKVSAPTTPYATSTILGKNKYFLDYGSGQELHPDLTLYVGNTYSFNISDSSNSGHPFSFSIHPDGTNNQVPQSSVSLTEGSNTITVSNSSGILLGMSVQIDGISDATIPFGTTVTNIVGNTITLSDPAETSGTGDLVFTGVEYVDGVERSSTNIDIKLSPSTPSTLYYYCQVHPDMAGEDGDEAVITVDPNNPKTFGSGFLLSVDNILETSPITLNVLDGEITSTTSVTTDSVTASSVQATNITADNTLTANTVSVSNQITGTNLTIDCDTLDVDSDLNVGNFVQITKTTGNVTTSGTLKSTSRLDVSDIFRVTKDPLDGYAKVATLGTADLIFTPSSGRIAKVDAISAFVIPTGGTLDRPGVGLKQDGSIRFNTDTDQYEGYNSSTDSWSSLGGVRDIDGNTYILAEANPGANDNNLWFYNDSVNSIRVNKNYMEFMGMKKIRSLNTAAPAYTNWVANKSVLVGEYLKYQHEIYEVVGAGQLDTSGNEPSDTSGNPFLNGTATLQYFTTAVSNLSFEELSQVNIGTVRSIPMLFQGDLTLTKNTISTAVSDITLKPNSGKKIICDAKTHLQIPSGTEAEKSSGTARNGSIRYNTTNQVYEGFSETTQTWGSLGGVKDVDQNTYIIPELGPGTNENILYFFNDNINTVQLTTTALDFTNINTITCSFDDSLEITAGTVTFDNSATTIDNTVANTTFIHTSRDRLDFGLSTGLVVDPLLRLDDQGDIYYNTGFGTGSESLVRLFDKELANLEISKYRITTSNASLLKGTTDNGSAVIYVPSTELSAKVEFIAHNTTTGEKEVIEFSVIDNGSDIFYTEVGTIQSNGSLITYTFDFNVNNAVRLNYSLATGVANANAVNVTVVSNVIKK